MWARARLVKKFSLYNEREPKLDLEMSDSLKEDFELPPEQQAIRDKCFHLSEAVVEFPKEEIETSIPERFEKIVSKFIDRIAIKTESESVTYAELSAMANQVAFSLIERKRPNSGLVALYFETSVSLIAAMLGALKGGKSFVVFDPSLPPPRVTTMLEDSQAALLLTEPKNRIAAQGICRNLCEVDVLDFSNSAQVAIPLRIEVSPNAEAFLLYTSGSTGKPKGVVWSHRHLLHHARSHAITSGISHQDRVALLSSGTSNAVTNTLLPLMVGATLLPYAVQREGVQRLGLWLGKEEISICIISSTLFRGLCETLTGQETFPKLRVIRSGSESLNTKDVELFKKHFPLHCVMINGLSTTETGILRSYAITHSTEVVGAEVPVGFPIDGKDIFLIGDDGNELGIDEMGEIAVESEYICAGYWRKPDLTSVKFRPAGTARKHIYFTGDLGIIRPDGCLIHKGRKDFRLKIRSYGVDLVEVQSCLREHSAIKDTIVVGRQNETEETLLIAYFTSSSQPGPTTSELRKFLIKTLPDYMIPSKFVQLEAMPFTPGGKIDRRALPEPERTRPELDTPIVSSRTPVEQQLVSIWVEILALDPVGIYDNFFDLGGHSLMAVKLVSEIEKMFGKSISVATLMQGPTVAQLASVLSEEEKSSPSPLITIQPSGSKPPFFCAHGTDSYLQLACYLGSDQPIYGLAQHLEGRKVCHTTIEAIAAHYLNEVRRIQPEGPYYIGGHSLGGLIAFEMAQQLKKQNQEVALLVLLDPGLPISRPSETTPKFDNPLRLSRQEIRRHLWLFRSWLKKAAQNRFKTMACEIYHALGTSLPTALQTYYVDQVVYGNIYSKAHHRYAPQAYAGKVVYLKSEDLRGRVTGWEELIGDGLEIHPVPGDHLSMLAEPNLKKVAETLKQCLANAQEEAASNAQLWKMTYGDRHLDRGGSSIGRKSTATSI